MRFFVVFQMWQELGAWDSEQNETAAHHETQQNRASGKHPRAVRRALSHARDTS